MNSLNDVAFVENGTYGVSDFPLRQTLLATSLLTAVFAHLSYDDIFCVFCMVSVNFVTRELRNLSET